MEQVLIAQMQGGSGQEQHGIGVLAEHGSQGIGIGDGVSGTVNIFENGELRRIEALPPESSLGIFFVTSKVAHLGFTAVLHFMAVLSLSLGVFNFLPLPVLDGGHLFFLFLEKIRNKPLSTRAEDFATKLGLAVILILVAFTFLNDLTRWAKINNKSDDKTVEKISQDR